MQIWYSFHLTIPSFLQFNTNTDSGRFDLVFMISLDERSEIDEFGIQENDLSRIEHEKWNMMNNREFWRIRMKKSWFSWQFGDWRMRLFMGKIDFEVWYEKYLWKLGVVYWKCGNFYDSFDRCSYFLFYQVERCMMCSWLIVLCYRDWGCEC